MFKKEPKDRSSDWDKKYDPEIYVDYAREEGLATLQMEHETSWDTYFLNN